MSLIETWPDVEGGLRTWLRAQATFTAVFGQRAFFGIPKKNTTWPICTIQRVGGGSEQGDAPVDVALVQVDVWGDLDASGNGRKADATAAVNTVRALLESITTNTRLSPTVVALGVTVESLVWLPDTADDRPRYSLTAEVRAISS